LPRSLDTVSDPEQELAIEAALAGRGGPELPRPVDRTIGDLVDRLAARFLDEVDAADLPLSDGSVIRLAAVDEVEQWLRGCAIRLRAGEHL
jgi:hypothetical protein